MDALDGVILEPLGFKDTTSDSLMMQICTECHSALKKHKVPHLALANHLYRGKLPGSKRWSVPSTVTWPILLASISLLIHRS